MIEPYVARVTIFPFKSLDGVDVHAARLTGRGGLCRDRRFAFFDASGTVVNGKSEPRLHRVSVHFDVELTTATFADRAGTSRFVFPLDARPDELGSWLGTVFGRRIDVRRCDDGGFPDDTNAAGPTVVSTATLAAVADWFEDLDVDSMRRRLRSNVEIGGVPAFWEDGLYGPAGRASPFRIGALTFEAINPCQRCIVPSRDARSGLVTPSFAKRVAERRAATLPSWVDRSRFDHFYRLAVNTRAGAGRLGRRVAVGDRVSVERSTGVGCEIGADL